MQVSFIQIPANPVMYTLWKWRLKIANRVFQQALINWLCKKNTDLRPVLFLLRKKEFLFLCVKFADKWNCI
jgi:hypothetical protein